MNHSLTSAHDSTGSPGLSWGTDRLALLGIVGAALLIRVLHFLAISDTALYRVHTVVESDSRAYWNWAQQILSGRLLDAYHAYTQSEQLTAPLDTWYRWWGGKEIFRTAPLFPYWVAGLLGVSGGSLAFVILVQLVVGALHPVVMYGLARRLFGTRVGLVAAALTAVYGPFIFYQGVLLRDWLPPLLEPLVLLALLGARESDRGRAWLLAGAALGLALMAKEAVLLFLPLVVLWLLWEEWPEWRRRIRAAVFLFGGFVLCVSPLLARNALVGAPLFSLSNRAAVSFIATHAADSNPSPGGNTWSATTRKRVLEHSEGKLLPTIWETLRTYQGDYGLLIRKELFRLRGLLDPHEVSGGEVSFDYGLDVSPALHYTLGYGVIFPLGVAGVLMSLRGWRRQRLIYLYFPAVLAGQAVGPIQERYRLTLVAVIIGYAAVALVRIFSRLRERRLGWAAGGLGLVLLIALVQQVWIPLFPARGYGRGADYLWNAQVYASEARYDRAVGELDRLRMKARDRPHLSKLAAEASLLEGDWRAAWAKSLIQEGRREEARRQVALAQAAYAQQSGLSYPYYNLGLLYLRLEEPGKAKAFFAQFLEREPEGIRADQIRRLLLQLGGSS